MGLSGSIVFRTVTNTISVEVLRKKANKQLTRFICVRMNLRISLIKRSLLVMGRILYCITPCVAIVLVRFIARCSRPDTPHLIVECCVSLYCTGLYLFAVYIFYFPLIKRRIALGNVPSLGQWGQQTSQSV